MGRNILAVIVAYIAMVAITIASLGATWAVLGAAGSFAGDGPYPSIAWLVSNVIFGFLAALAGGCIARKIGRSDLAVKLLVGAILLLGLYGALTAESSYQKRVEAAGIDKPVAELTFLEAGAVAKNPTWFLWTIPLIGAAGALLGGRKRSPSPTQ